MTCSPAMSTARISAGTILAAWAFSAAANLSTSSLIGYTSENGGRMKLEQVTALLLISFIVLFGGLIAIDRLGLRQPPAPPVTWEYLTLAHVNMVGANDEWRGDVDG